jgi:hypothetical protein
MKFGGVTAWTDATRTAFQAQMMKGLGDIAGTKWGDLTEWDRRSLGRSGITEDDWGVINTAQLGQYGGSHYLTPDSIYGTGHENAANIVPKVLGMIREEGEYAVLNPDLAAKVITSATPGTWSGELQKCFYQFKAFPLAMVSRHWGRMADMYRTQDYRVEGAPRLASPIAYAGALIASTTLMGAISNQIKSLTLGNDPESMAKASFWGRAFLKGGGAGFAGDLISSVVASRDIGDAVAGLLGPVASTAYQPIHIAYTAATAVAEGKDTHVAADSFKYVQSNFPLLNLWYLKTVLNRAIWDSVAENLSPGVIRRNMNRTQKIYGTQPYWEPGTASPQRAPDFSAAFSLPN